MDIVTDNLRYRKLGAALNEAVANYQEEMTALIADLLTRNDKPSFRVAQELFKRDWGACRGYNDHWAVGKLGPTGLWHDAVLSWDQPIHSLGNITFRTAVENVGAQLGFAIIADDSTTSPSHDPSTTYSISDVVEYLGHLTMEFGIN